MTAEPEFEEEEEEYDEEEPEADSTAQVTPKHRLRRTPPSPPPF